jgi:hypothetical protein
MRRSRLSWSIRPEGITKIFQKITASLPKHLRKLLVDMTGEESISAHHLRQTPRWAITVPSAPQYHAHHSNGAAQEAQRRMPCHLEGPHVPHFNGGADSPSTLTDTHTRETSQAVPH